MRWVGGGVFGARQIVAGVGVGGWVYGARGCRSNRGPPPPHVCFQLRRHLEGGPKGRKCKANTKEIQRKIKANSKECERAI